MQVKDKTKTPPPFTDSIFHSNQYPEEKRNHFISRNRRNNKTLRNGQRKHQMRPILNFLLMGILAVGSIGIFAALPETYVGGYSDVNIENPKEYLSFGETTYFVDKDNLTITTEILKNNPYVSLSDVEVSYKILINGEEYDDYLPYMYMPAIGFGEEKTYISNTIDGITELKNDPNASIEIKPYFADLSSYVDTLDEYMYLDEEEEGLSDEELLKKYEKEYVDPHSFEILSDGKDNPTHSVTFTIQNIGRSEYLNCEYQILFKKDGKVVYADTDYFSPYHSDDTIGSVTYTPKTNIEDYDEVEVYQINS